MMARHEAIPPSPSPWSDSKEYWDGCRRHELLIPRCLDCGHLFFYPRQFCPACMSPRVEWVKSAGRGRVYSFSVVYMPFRGLFSQQDVPYTVAIIELEEGVRLMSNVIGCSPEQVKVEMPVTVIFDDLPSGVTLPKFRPADSGQAR